MKLAPDFGRVVDGEIQCDVMTGSRLAEGFGEKVEPIFERKRFEKAV